MALLVEEGHGGDVANALIAGFALDGVDGAEDAHLQIDRRLLHEDSPCSSGRRRLKQKRIRSATTARVVGLWRRFGVGQPHRRALGIR